MNAFVRRIPLPNPFFEGEINTWLIEDNPLTLVDAGLNSSESLAALRLGLAAIGYRIEDVQRVLLTHRHPDHVGLSREIVELSGAEVWIHVEDQVAFDNPSERAAGFPQTLAEGLGAWGAPREVLRPVVDFFRQTTVTIPEVEAKVLHDGQILVAEKYPLTVHHTPGHSQGHVTFECGNILLVGDHVLERITPNIGSGEFHARGSLQKYLDGLCLMQQLATPETVACPGHGREFQTIAERAREIARHHAEREMRVLEILRGLKHCTVYEMARALFGTMDSVHLMLGMGEAFAHLDKLEAEGKIGMKSDGFSID